MKTLNQMKDGKIEEIIRLCGWTPINMCVTSSDEFWVAMCSNDTTQSSCSIVRIYRETNNLIR